MDGVHKNDVNAGHKAAEPSGVNASAELRDQCLHLRRAGQAGQALDLANAAIAKHPKAMRPHLEKALSLSALGQDTAEEIKAWWDCIEKFPNQTWPKWFENLRAAVEKQQGNLRFSTNSEAALAEIERIHTAASKAWPNTEGTELPTENLSPDQAKANRVHEWILAGRANLRSQLPIETGALDAWDAYFEHYQGKAPFTYYLRYIRVIERFDPQNAKDRVERLFTRSQEIWPIELLSSEPNDRHEKHNLQMAKLLYFELAQRLLADRHFDQAKELLAKFTGQDNLSPMARELEQIADSLALWTTYKDLAAADPRFNDYGSIMPWRSENASEKVVFVFSGVCGRMSLTQSSIHLVLQKLGCHIVYISDQNNSFFLNGTDWETVDQLCQKLRIIAHEMGATRFFTLGNSSGGYAALLYGEKLGAEKVLAVSPITTPLKTSWPSTQEFFEDMKRRQPDLVADLDDYYVNSPQRPKVTIAFGEKSIRDRKAAEAMLVVPDVKHVMAPGYSRHASLTWFVAHNKFLPLLQDLLDEPSED